MTRYKLQLIMNRNLGEVRNPSLNQIPCESRRALCGFLRLSVLRQAILIDMLIRVQVPLKWNLFRRKPENEQTDGKWVSRT